MLVGQTIGSGAYRFEIEEELGSGAMGTVYRATFYQDGKTRPVALKMIALGLLGNESAMARFDREATILKQLRHPHIVRLIAAGRWQKTPFIAMEFIEGEPLDRALARRGKLGWEEIAAYGRQLCDALQHAHEKGIIHRDLKPSNLMITEDGTLKLTDFGIAKDTDVTALTGANSTIGTAAYMSPEQCKGDKNLTNKSDLYSLGIVFFELLSGKKPFYADSTVDMFLKHVNEPPPRVGKIVQNLPSKMEALILQLLEKDKEDRPVDAAWVGRMLAEIEEDAVARKSAGLDAATARRIDRRADGPPIDEADREAARALKGLKKKKKKKAVPWYEKKSTKAAGILFLLAAMGVGVYLATRPPSPEKLAAAIDPAQPQASLPAAEEYLRQYGDRPGETTDKAAEVFRKGKVLEREKQLTKRFGVAKWRDDPEGDDPEAYRDAMLALQLERDGKLRPAADLWEKIKVRFAEDAKLPYTFDSEKLGKARWGWLAEERLKDIKAVQTRTRELEMKIAENRKYEKPIPFEPTNPESVAARALRLEHFKDYDKAARTWDRLIALTEQDLEQHVWFLMASERRAAIPKDAADGAANRRLALVQNQVNDADRRLKELKNASARSRVEWIGLRIICRDVIELYEDETIKDDKDDIGRGLVDAIKRARKILDEASKES